MLVYTVHVRLLSGATFIYAVQPSSNRAAPGMFFSYAKWHRGVFVWFEMRVAPVAVIWHLPHH